MLGEGERTQGKNWFLKLGLKVMDFIMAFQCTCTNLLSTRFTMLPSPIVTLPDDFFLVHSSLFVAPQHLFHHYHFPSLQLPLRSFLMILFLVSSHTHQDSVRERKHSVFDYLSLAHFISRNHFQFCPFFCKCHSFIFFSVE